MVVIRYPAIVDDDAAEAYFQAFEKHAIGSPYTSDSQTRRDSQNIAQSIIAKSNYFAMSLYRELQDELPPRNIGYWNGGCFAGRASDRGHGLIIDPDGTTVEYLTRKHNPQMNTGLSWD